MAESIELNLLPFHPQKIPVDRVIALSALVEALKKEEVEIQEVKLYQNGFLVVFKDILGDAIIHDGSYGHNFGEFETYKMPWDHGDVSVHSPETLAKMLGALKRGEDWEEIEKGGD